jgi:hypothetical protein
VQNEPRVNLFSDKALIFPVGSTKRQRRCQPQVGAPNAGASARATADAAQAPTGTIARGKPAGESDGRRDTGQPNITGPPTEAAPLTSAAQGSTMGPLFPKSRSRLRHTPTTPPSRSGPFSSQSWRSRRANVSAIANNCGRLPQLVQSFAVFFRPEAPARWIRTEAEGDLRPRSAPQFPGHRVPALSTA